MGDFALNGDKETSYTDSCSFQLVRFDWATFLELANNFNTFKHCRLIKSCQAKDLIVAIGKPIALNNSIST